jgi:hypothetical protein
MNQEDLEQLAGEVGKKAAAKFEKMSKDFEDKINAAAKDMAKGLVTEEKFAEMQQEGLKKLNDHLAKLEEKVKEQGTVIAGMNEKAGSGEKRRTIEDVIKEAIPEMEKVFAAKRIGDRMQIDLKAAAITSIGNTIGAQTNAPSSPYAPGLGGADLTLYDIMQNPAFITSKVDMGRTNQSRIAWLNEVSVQGTPGLVLEGNAKPLTQHTFVVEMSIAKKVAAYIVVTEEFQADLEMLFAQVKALLMNDLLRFFDGQVQSDVIANATGYVTPNPLVGSVAFATLWDAILTLQAQIITNNYQPNAVGLNPYTYAKLEMVKDSQGRYNVPPFSEDIRSEIVQSNKVYPNMAFVGDMKQFHVLMYKDPTMTVGWQNDDFIKNQFTIVAELRFHDFISTARKPAIAYANLATVRSSITGTGS